MNNIYKKLKRAFSLLELTICILIVSIIVVVCVPLIMDQMKKTEEYSYFLGFKTVEKLGSQIVAFGDPADEPVAMNSQDMDFGNGLYKLASTNIGKLLKKITPEAVAETQKTRTILLSFPSYEYDLARLCNGNTNVIKDYEDEAGNSFTPEEIAGMGCLDIYTRNESLKLRFACDDGTYANTTYLASTADSPEEFCQKVKAHCLSKYSTYNPKYEFERITLNQAGNRSEYYQCNVYYEQENVPTTGATGEQSTGIYPTYSVSTCNGFGYYNMDSSGSLKTICSCGTGTLPAVNHPNICCSALSITAGNVPYANKNGTCVSTGCKIGTFNEKTGTCCPANSFYSRTLGHCSCAQGYEPNDSENFTACVKIEPIVCPTGYHLDADSNVCVVNAPITKAKRFCELIIDNYNISYSKCDAESFNGSSTYSDGTEPIAYNKTLFDAITANNTKPYLSADAVEGAFNSVLPNIVFSNGLKLWILGDKVASIAGLSFNPTDYSPEINACVDMKKYTKTGCDNLLGTSYFCQGANRCYAIKNGSSAAKLADARNCCPTVDLEDFKSSYAGNGYLRDPRAYAINGFTVFVDITGEKDSDQGGGTLWKDVFPFYIAANGIVYPAYPLNASKSDISLYQGGNSSALNSDVYYFDVVTRQDGTKIRKKQMAYTSIPYSRAQCFALQVSAFTPYCQNLGSKFRLSRIGKTYEKMDQYIYSDENPCWKHRCYVHVKNKIKFL